MKNLTFAFLSIFTFFSCNRDDNTTIVTQTNPLQTTWNLVKFEDSLIPTQNFNINTIQWTFNTNTINVVIQNGTNILGSLPLKVNGTYPYTLNGNQITIQNISYKFEIVGNVLKIEDLVGQVADGRVITFNRI